MKRRGTGPVATVMVAGLVVTGMSGAGNASAGERQFGAGKGKGEASIVAAEGAVGGIADLSVLETHTKSRVSPRTDKAAANWNLAEVRVGDTAYQLPERPFKAKTKEDPSGAEGRDHFGTAAETLKLPESGQTVEADWDQLREDASFLAEELTGTDMDPDGGPRGEDDVSMLDGALLKVVTNPAGLTTEQSGERSYAHAQSEVELVRMLEGLNTIIDAGPGDHGSVTEDGQAGAWSREVKIEEMRLLQLSALLRLLHVNVDLLPPTVMAAMVDVLGVEPGDLAEHTSEFTKAELKALFDEFGDLEGTVAAAEGLLGAVLDGAGLVGCDEIDQFVKQAEGVSLVKRSRAFGVEPLDCVGGLNALEEYLRRVERLVNDFSALVHTTGEEVALVGVDDIDMGMTATAAVTEAGVPVGGVAIDATAAVVRFGKETVGSFSLEDNMDAWNALEDQVNRRINTLLAPLGLAFEDMVRIRMAPTVVEDVGMAGKWVTAQGQFEFMKVYVAPPAIDPEQLIRDVGGTIGVDVGALVDGVVALLPVGPSGTGEVVGSVEDTFGDLEDTTDVEDVVDDLVEGLDIAGGGDVGGAGALLGQVEAADPIQFTFGVMGTQVRHTRAGWSVDTCPVCGGSGDSSTGLANTPWDPSLGSPRPDGGLPGQDTPLPKTGGYPGALAMLVTASGTLLLWRRK